MLIVLITSLIVKDIVTDIDHIDDVVCGLQFPLSQVPIRKQTSLGNERILGVNT